MTIHLPEDLEIYVQNEVRSGRFASLDEAITEALRLLREKRQDAEAQRGDADEVNQRLLDAGLLSHIPARRDPATYREFPPIAVEGEPLSNTILRERR